MLKIIFNQVVKRLFPNRSMQSLTQSEILKAQNQAIQIMNRTKGKTGEVMDLTGRRIDTSKPIIGGKNVAETEEQVKARLLKTQQETLERLRNKKKTVEDFSNDGDFDPGGMASGGLARVGMVMGGSVWKKFIEGLFIKTSNNIRQGKGKWAGLNQDQWMKQHDDLTKILKKWEMSGRKGLPEGASEFLGMNDLQVSKAIKDAEKQVLSKPTKTLEGLESKGTIDISDPEVADEFSRFIKESDPEGYKKLEQQIQSDDLFDAEGKLNKKAVLQEVKDSEEKMLLDKFDVKGRTKQASGGIARAGMFGGKLALDALRKLITKKYTGKIDDSLLKRMLADDNPQRISEVMATIDEAMIMQSKGMKNDAIMDTFKESWKRQKNASGGIAGQLHLNQGGRAGFANGSPAVDPRMLQSYDQNKAENEAQRQINQAVRGGTYDQFLTQNLPQSQGQHYENLYGTSSRSPTDFTGTFRHRQDQLVKELVRSQYNKAQPPKSRPVTGPPISMPMITSLEEMNKISQQYRTPEYQKPSFQERMGGESWDMLSDNDQYRIAQEYPGQTPPRRNLGFIPDSFAKGGRASLSKGGLADILGV